MYVIAATNKEPCIGSKEIREIRHMYTRIFIDRSVIVALSA
jgi:hypothetical protein